MAKYIPVGAIKHLLNFEWWQHGWSIGHNKRDRWFLSAHKWWRGPKLEFEWHNYPLAKYGENRGSDTLFLSVGGKAEDGWTLTCWPPENNRLAKLLRKIPAKVWRKY